MKKITCLLFSLYITVSCFAIEKRNLLQNSYTLKSIAEYLVKDNSWVTYPAYNNRAAWLKFPAELRSGYIKLGEKYLGYTWPTIPATKYLDFTRSGNRQSMEKPFQERKEALEALVMAELMEGKGRFTDDIINGVFSFCEQTYWGYSAHFYMYRTNGVNPEVENPTTVLPDIDDPIVDLGVGEVANDLAWVWYFFHDEFDKVSPIISKRLKREIKMKVLDPYYERDDYWWITGWGKGAVNNWNPWCNYNVLNCIMLIEDDPVKRAQGIYKTMSSVDLFLNIYKDDGGCTEGPSYWNVAGGRLYDYLDLLRKASNGKINIFDNELVKNIGRYIYRVYISNGDYYTNFADASPKIQQRGGMVYRYGKSIKDAEMEGFGAFLLSRSNYEKKPHLGTFGAVLEDLFGLEGWKQTKPVEPLISDFYFPYLQIAQGRDKSGTTDGFYFAAKGGSNGEGHGHNDVGSCLLYYNGQPVLIDVGVGTYTKETFSKQRYNIWTMQSLYHNLPVINGVAQKAGGSFKADNSNFSASKNKVSFATDIAGAYPSDAKAEKWVRSYILERGKKFRINDSFQLSENTSHSQLNFMTALQCKIVKPGMLELKGSNFDLQMVYNPQLLSAHIENKKIDDVKLQNVWGNDLYRIVFDVKSKGLKGNVSIDVLENK